MSMFSMGGVKDAKVVSNSFLGAGIHNVIFKGLNKADISQSAMEVQFEAVDGSGTHIERIFEPRSNERKVVSWGTSASEADNFMCKVKQIIDALDPELSHKIEADGDKFTAPDFDGFITLLKKYLDKKIGTQTQIKLVPGNQGNYVHFPQYVARINKDGNLYMGTKVIGDNLVLTASEKTAIENVVNAKPTNMSKQDDELADLRKDFEPLNNDDSDDDELPF